MREYVVCVLHWSHNLSPEAAATAEEKKALSESSNKGQTIKSAKHFSFSFEII